MAYTDWHLSGINFSACNCNWGCPCQFNALPSYGDCRATMAARIDQGYFGAVNLDGLKFVALAAFPGALHEGNGEIMAVIDERADARQREGLLEILSGKHSEPGATFFNILSMVVTKVHPPLFKPITLEVDMKARTGRVSVPGVIETRAEPIKNPITGEPHQVRVVLPHGFEYHEAEYASSTVKSGAPVAHDWSGRHSHIAVLDMGPKGVRH
jgi:hypothetical protein